MPGTATEGYIRLSFYYPGTYLEDTVSSRWSYPVNIFKLFFFFFFLQMFQRKCLAKIKNDWDETHLY